MNEILRLKNLSKKYLHTTKKINILKSINLKIKYGELVSLVGPSGSGKSTLLHLIALLDKPNSGDIYFNNKNLTKLHEVEKDNIRKKNISIIYQQNNLLNDFTAIENIILPLIINNQDWNSSVKKAKKILSVMNLGNRINHFPNELSGGEQQRVAVARALIVEPDLILADEPTGSLDRKTANEIFDIIISLKSKQRTIIYATHNRDLANRADYKLSILDGIVSRING